MICRKYQLHDVPVRLVQHCRICANCFENSAHILAHFTTDLCFSLFIFFSNHAFMFMLKLSYIFLPFLIHVFAVKDMQQSANAV